jgi:DUF438 domain-containing protein
MAQIPTRQSNASPRDSIAKVGSMEKALKEGVKQRADFRVGIDLAFVVQHLFHLVAVADLPSTRGGV